MNKEVAVVLVTFNRLALLKQSISKILEQTTPVEKIFIINNKSTDGTEVYLKLYEDDDRFKIINLKENVGGAGGFSAGLKEAYSYGPYDFYWIMDDDTLPEPDSLTNLLTVKTQAGVLASNVLWRDTDEVSIMNIPKPDNKWTAKSLDDLYRISSSSFVSMLISNKAIEICGLPIKEFFIWGDDKEYSNRIIKKLDGYFVPKSIVRHQTKTNTGIDIINEPNKGRINRYFYVERNELYIAKRDGLKATIKNELSFLSLIIKICIRKSNFKLKKLKTIIKGHFAGWFFKPKVEQVTQKEKLND
ncbi:glycosyltransferase family 2 protein [Fructilactobacillus sanfranciscensis]|uniref:glycosyltransferase family 2 protein n=1 Tax=Fructilactobacillus sanfranciscensis TaxID=1625 RepID=UPI0031F9C378